MNGKAAKGIRRDIRRAVGADALEVVNQQSQVLNQAVPEIGRLRERVTALEEDSASLIHAHSTLRADYQDFLARPLWGRVRWLLGI